MSLDPSTILASGSLAALILLAASWVARAVAWWVERQDRRRRDYWNDDVDDD